jgi:ATP/maltotriose-dependent transcriptional regulator MalT
MTQENKRHQSFPLRLPPSILQQANDLADREGVSLDHFIGLAVAEKISRADQGQIWTSSEQLAHLVSSVSRPKYADATDSQGRPLLTAREQQVLHLLADGLSNYQLGIVLKVSGHTIKRHLSRIYEKLGVSNRLEAVVSAFTPHHALPIAVRAGGETTSEQGSDD